ncbi:hypothetical protein POTOM_024289 [Populus tomentosa]|uniref:Uncharacterized protein n=1 Tax=Populus tomentosa TaxID=118781 RepID=A0A8X7ZV11_POPTO|nr:hypothetical protein POTOM_024289 [Populus tomentosa]
MFCSLMQFSEDSLVRSTFIFPWYRDTHQGNLICGRFLGDLAGTDELLSSAFFFFLLPSTDKMIADRSTIAAYRCHEQPFLPFIELSEAHSRTIT